ncbi:MAG: flagellar hook basal-body protein [Terriglobia bacterium]
MNSGLYTACSGLKANAEMLEVLSNNLANSNTTAFKGDESFFRIYNHALSESTVAPLDRVINDSTVVQGSLTNFQPGPLIQTGGTLDVALEGPGFFVLDGPGGPLYTRNGNFHLSAEGKLINADGLPVLGKKGRFVSRRDRSAFLRLARFSSLEAGGLIRSRSSTSRIGRSFKK